MTQHLIRQMVTLQPIDPDVWKEVVSPWVMPDLCNERVKLKISLIWGIDRYSHVIILVSIVTFNHMGGWRRGSRSCRRSICERIRILPP